MADHRLLLPHRTFLPLLLCCCWCLGTAVAVVVGDDTVVVVAKDSAAVHFSEPKLNNSYQSSERFDSRGMEHLYTITNFFLDLVLRGNSTPSVISQNEDELVQAQKDGNLVPVLEELVVDHWDDIVLHYLPLIAVVGVGLLLTLLVPIVGLCFCCCRCAGKCGGKENPFDRKYDRCRRVVDGLILSLFVILILFGVVCAFVTNEYLRQGVSRLPARLQTSLSDVDLYLNNTAKELDGLLINNFQQLQEKLEKSLDECGVEIKDELGRISKAAAIDNLTEIVEGLGSIKDDLDDIVTYTNVLLYNASNLNDDLLRTQNELERLLKSCSEEVCQEILSQYDLSQLEVQADFQQYLANVLLPKLPNVTQTAEEISQLIADNIEGEVEAGQKKFDDISKQIQQEVDTAIPNVQVQIQSVGGQLQQVALNITDVISKVDLTPAKSYIGDQQDVIDEYSQYRYYAGIGVCSAALLILLCFIGGLCCGCCGKRPGNIYGDDSCNKGAGANFLLAGVHLTFLLFSVLMLITTGLFIIGGLSGILVCDQLQSSDSGGNMTLLQAVDDLFIHVDSFYPTNTSVSLVEIIRDCNKNISAYEVLRLSTVMDISNIEQYREKFGIDETIDQLTSQINVDTSNIVLLTDEAKQQLMELANSTLAYINYTAYTVVLEQQITSVDLTALANALADAAADIPPNNIAKDGLERMARRLRIEQGMLNELKEVVGDLKDATLSLEKHVKLNRSSLTEAVNELIRLVESAEDNLHVNGSSEIIQVANKYADDFIRDIDSYLDYVVSKIENDVGRCGPVSNAYNASVVAVCSYILNPFNGFWASVGWCLIFFLPCIVVSVFLITLYRKTEPYQGPVFEPVSDGKRRARRSSYQETYDNRNGYTYSPDYTPPYNPAAVARPETRSTPYTGVASGGGAGDTEPKNFIRGWDFPNGGPPGYTSPGDTPEYERPPPYYFPGPGNVK